VQEAYQQYVSASFRHHNPYFPGDAEALKAAMQGMRPQFPQKPSTSSVSWSMAIWWRFTPSYALKPGDLIC